jgi:HAD superfamily hydrolase (TIGR01458 family)
LKTTGTVRGVILDLDGVLHVRDRVVPGAPEAVRRLRAAGIPLRFVTNTTRRPRRAIIEALTRFGFDITADEVLTPAAAVCERLTEMAESPYLLIHADLSEDFAAFGTGGTDAVVLGDAGDAFRYDTLNRAFRLLMEGAPLYALAANRYFQDDDGLSLDVGAFVAALEYASGITAELFGKPAPAFFQAALEGLGCRTEETVVIGDDVEADVNGALALGFGGVLVRTGKYRPEDAARLASGGVIVADISEAVDRILGAK